jgi:hypothetical protein
MRKICFFSALLLLGVLNFFFSYVPTVLADTPIDITNPPGVTTLPSPNIDYETTGSSPTDTLTKIDYWVSSSAPTSSIRYKTLEYYIVLHNSDGTVSKVFSFQPTVSIPSSGTVIDEFIVTAQNLIDAGFTQNDLTLQNLSQVGLSATIEIYNDSTGDVLATFGDQNSIPSTIDPIIQQTAGNIGFGSTDINDMESRYVDDILTVIPPPVTPKPKPTSTSDTCSLQVNSPTTLTEDNVPDYWEYTYGTPDSFGNCITNQVWEPYQEELRMSITSPDPATVKAGQGTSVTVTTWYENNDPSAWNGSSYNTGVPTVTMSGPNTDDWQSYKLNQTRMTANMVLQSTQVYTEDFDEMTYYPGCLGGDPILVGYNVPVVKQTWIIPYARFDDTNGWTMSQTPPTDIDNQYVFGGLNRWYFGFDIPDGQTFNLQFLAQGGSTGTMEVCGNDQISIKGSPYDDIIVTTIDPNNPFPGGEPTAWQGFESNITNLAGWFRESGAELQKKLEQWETESLLGKIFTFLHGNVQNGVKSMDSPSPSP